MTFYTNLKATSDRLLAKFAQGAVTIGTSVTTPGANVWDAPTTEYVYEPINAAVRGVSQKYVDGVNIVSTDLQVIASIGDYTPDAGDLMQIDGHNVVILRQDKIPAAGVTVAWRFLVRG